MMIEIDFDSEVPIYTQLVCQIKKGIALGSLAPGEPLPSVRNLASDIGINLHTVNKAYKQLVGEGVVIQVKKGYEIAEKTPPDISEAYLKVMMQQIDNLVVDAMVFDLDILDLLKKSKTKLEGEMSRD